MKKTIKNKKRSATGKLVLGFLAVTVIGTLLLMLPISTASGKPAPFLTAAFTAVSASCITGLTVVETGIYWSVFGQTVIILLIQIGGLGFMSVALFLSLMIKRAISPGERMMLIMSYNMNSYASTNGLLSRIILGTLVTEGAGALLLATRFVPQFGLKGIWYSVFHSISAFCNAGFDVFGKGNSLGDYVTDPVVSLTICALVWVGGIGFLVWSDILQILTRKTKRISIYSRFVLTLSLIMTLSGMLLTAIFEWNNQSTIASFNFGEKLLASLFQSVTWRTAGFATIDGALIAEPTKLIGVIFMFVGGASGSTAGGVKLATVGVLAVAVWSVAVGRSSVNVFRRKISNDTIMRAMTIVTMQILLFFISAAVIVSIEGRSALDIVYEVVSAGATVGLTAGLTPSLSAPSLVILMFLMFLGRVGVTSVTYAIMMKMRESDSVIEYPEANLLIG